jgi:HK97 gp10 family phage protein
MEAWVMPIRGRMTTNGFEEYLDRLRQAGQDVEEAADAALIAGADVLVDGMLARVPRDTGNLAAQIDRSEPEREGSLHFIYVGVRRYRDGLDEDTGRYGGVQEYGSANTPAHPYIRPTLDKDMGKARRAMREEFERRRLL